MATWPVELRQRWGDRAGLLQDGGADWREAERLAFDEVNGGIPSDAQDHGRETPDRPSPPAPFARLKGPRRTPWGTRVWSDPGTPPIELFGPP